MRYLCIIILSVLSVFVRAQDTTFNILNHSYPSTNSIYSIDKLGSEYYLLMSQMDTPNYYQYVNYGILKLNSELQIIDSVMIDIDKTVIAINGRGFAVSPIDTSIVFCGTIRDQGNQYNGYLVKFNNELDTLWSKQILHPDTAYADTAQNPVVVLQDIKITPEGHYLIIGNYNHHCQGNIDRSFIMKMDTAGNILWQKFLDPAVYQSYITNIEIDPIDSGFYFVSSKTDFYLYKYDKNGNYLWSKKFHTDVKIPYVSKIKVVDNNIIIGTNYYIPPVIINDGPIPRLYITSIDRTTQNINWTKRFKSISIWSQYLRQELIDIEETPSGNLIVGSVGMTYKDSNFTGSHRAFLLMLNSNGDSLWSHYYCYQNDSAGVEDMQFNDMVVCDDGGILFGGSYYSYPLDPQFIRAWLVKTDSMGNAPGMFTVDIKDNELVINNVELKIYPNPTTDNMNLSMAKPPRQELQLEIYNISGQLVMQQRLPTFEKQHRINIQHLPSGVYLVSLLSDNQVVYSGKIIKE